MGNIISFFGGVSTSSPGLDSCDVRAFSSILGFAWDELHALRISSTMGVSSKNFLIELLLGLCKTCKKADIVVPLVLYLPHC